MSHKRLRLHIPNAADNVIPYEIYPSSMGNKKILKAKRLTTAMKLCTGNLESVADKLRYARLSAGFQQDELANKLGIDKTTLLRYENGRVVEENMQIDILMRIAITCGMNKYFCCTPYHCFIVNNAGKQIKEYRKMNGLTQKNFATTLSVALNTVKRWERNENKPPKYIWELIKDIESLNS